jgi:hypothetical protein
MNSKLPTNKNFGIVFSIVFFAIFLYILINNDIFNYWLIGVSSVFLILGLINSKILTPLNKIWFKLGNLLGRVVAPIVMMLIFFLVVTPTAIIMKILKKDLLNIKKNDSTSYWISKPEPESKMKNQF